MADPMTPERPRCGSPCLKHAHACDRSPRHTGFHRDVQQKGDHTCAWDSPGPKDFPAVMTALGSARAEVERLRAERARAVDALGDIGQTAEAATGDLEDGINAELIARAETVDAQSRILGHAEAERDRLAEQAERVRARHTGVCSGACGLDDACECDDIDLICAEDNDRWPCPTRRDLDGTEAGQ